MWSPRWSALAAAVLYVIASDAPGFNLADGFAANGYGEHSPGNYGLVACLIAEVLLTMMFLFIIMGATHGKAPAGFAPLAIGLGLTLIHLISIPITNTSVNPARSTGAGAVRRRLGARPALAVLGGTAGRRSAGWRALPLVERGTLRPGHRRSGTVARRNRRTAGFDERPAPRRTVTPLSLTQLLLGTTTLIRCYCLLNMRPKRQTDRHR